MIISIQTAHRMHAELRQSNIDGSDARVSGNDGANG